MAARLLNSATLGNVIRVLPNHARHKITNIPKKCLQTSSCLYDTTSVKMPALSPTMTEGTIVKWYKQEGESVAPGDILCDIQTDKAVVSFELEEEGVLAKILKPENSKDVKIGTLIALMVEEGEDWQAVTIPADEEPSESGQSAAVSQPSPAPAATKPTADPAVHSYGPAVRSLLDIYQIKVSDISGTGPHKRVLKGDVLKYINAHNLKAVPVEVALPAAPVSKPATAPPSTPAAAPKPAPKLTPLSETEDYIDLELTNMRKTIARRLTESKTSIPHAYSTITCEMDEILAVRKKLIADGTKVSVNDFIVKAVAVALHQVPEVNAVWTGDARRLQDNIDICVAVATDNGLITPIVKDAIGKGLAEISNEVKELAGRARQGKLQPHEFQGGSFTISNLGMFGITEFSAVINPPQACILAVGGSKIILGEDGEPHTTMTVTLSSDARVVDDALAAHFLEVFAETMETPSTMLSQGLKPNVAEGESSLHADTLSKLFAN